MKGNWLCRSICRYLVRRVGKKGLAESGKKDFIREDVFQMRAN